MHQGDIFDIRVYSFSPRLSPYSAASIAQTLRPQHLSEGMISPSVLKIRTAQVFRIYRIRGL